MKASKVLLVIMIAFVWQLGANALTLDQTCLVALMKPSQYVAHGSIEEIRTLGGEERPTILATFRVSQVLKGEDVPGELEIRFTGEVTNEDRVATPPYEAALTPTEEVVLFLTRLEGGEIRVTNGVQGKFIVSEAEGGEEIVRCAIGSIPLGNEDPEDWPAEMPLTEFLKRLRKIATFPQ
jgi:hypothetical protein